MQCKLFPFAVAMFFSQIILYCLFQVSRKLSLNLIPVLIAFPHSYKQKSFLCSTCIFGKLQFLFKVEGVCSQQRISTTFSTYFMNTQRPLTYILYPAFSNFCQLPSSRNTLFVAFHTTSDELFYLMTWIYTCRAMVPLYLRDLAVSYM